MKTKTKKQAKPEPIGRVTYFVPEDIPFIGSSKPALPRDRPHLIIPITKDGKCQRAQVVEAMAKAMWGEDQNHPWGSLGAAVVHSAIKRDASTALTRLGWPEGGES